MPGHNEIGIMFNKKPDIILPRFENNNSFVTMDFENIFRYKEREHEG
jgi:hypothetical protein